MCAPILHGLVFSWAKNLVSLKICPGLFFGLFFFNTIKTYHFILILFYWYLSKKIKKKSHIYIFINLLCILRLGQWRPPFHTARWEPSKDLSYWQKKSAQQHRNRATPSSAEQWWRPILTKWRQSDVTCPLHSVDWMTWGSTVTPCLYSTKVDPVFKNMHIFVTCVLKITNTFL